MIDQEGRVLDIGTWLGEYLKGTLASSWTDGVVLAIVLILLIASLAAWNEWPRWTKFVEQAPGLMTSLGIFGTFVGIVVGLMNFDINLSAIDKSIVHLLDGLKTAFITSVAGLTGAIAFNVLDAVFFESRRRAKPKVLTSTPDLIHKCLEDQLLVLRLTHLSLAGSEEGSLVGQIKLLKADLNEFKTVSQREAREFKAELFFELRRFAQMLSESATKQVIEALERVIRDFNNNLTEQFGENFKALDASVKKLVDWQIEYKGQIETMAEQYRQSVDALIETKTAVAGIKEDCNEIPIAMAKLRSVMQVNQHQIGELGRHLEAFVTLREKAIEAIPTVHARLKEIGDHLAGGVNQIRASLSEAASGFLSSVGAANASISTMAMKVEGETERIGGVLDAAAVGFTKTTEASLLKIEESGARVNQGLNKAAHEIVVGADQISTILNNSSTTLHQRLGELTELLRVREQEMVQRLVSSNKTVEEGFARLAGEIGRYTNAVASEVDGGVKSLGGAIAALGGEIKQQSETFRKILSQIFEQYLEQSSQQSMAFREHGIRVQQEISRVNDEMGRQVQTGAERAMQAVLAQISAAAKVTQEAINAEMSAMDEARQRELNRVISDLGTALASITRRFADDYSRFTTYMTDLQKLTQNAAAVRQ